MAFNRVRNLFNSLLSVFSCVSKRAATDGDSERLPPAPRSAPPPSDNTGTPVDADPVRNLPQNSSTTDNVPTVVPSRDLPAPCPPPSPSSALSTNVDDDGSAPQVQNSTGDLPIVTPEPSSPEMGCTPVTVPSSVIDELESLVNAASTDPQEEVKTVESEPLPADGKPTQPPSSLSIAVKDTTARQNPCTSHVSGDDLPTVMPELSAPEMGCASVIASVSMATNVASTGTQKLTGDESEQLRPDNTPFLSHSTSNVAVGDAPDLQNSLPSQVSATDNSPTVTPESSAPEIGSTPVTVPGSVSDKLKSIMNLASTTTPEKLTVDEHEWLPPSDAYEPISSPSPSIVPSASVDDVPVQQSSSADLPTITPESSIPEMACTPVTIPKSVSDKLKNNMGLLSVHPHSKEEIQIVENCEELRQPSPAPRLKQRTKTRSNKRSKSSCHSGLDRCDLSAITSKPSAPVIGSVPVTVPGNVTDKLWCILNMASTKPSPRCREGVVTFAQPLLNDEDFCLRVRQKRVRLETVTVSTDSITGYVRVANLSFLKRVAVRYTMNKWRDYLEVEAEWIESVGDGEMDRFMFTLPALALPGELSFAVCYNGHWDSNEERNYTVLFESV